MEFRFENIGIVKSAKIELNGLTVITGLNDIGKSFIGKSIFALIQTFKNSYKQELSKKIYALNDLINEIFSLHRRIVPFNADRTKKFNTSSVFNRLSIDLANRAPYAFILNYLDEYTESVITDIKTYYNNPSQIVIRDRTGRYIGEEVNPILLQIEALHNRLKSDLIIDIDEEKSYKNYFDEVVVQKLFQGQFNNLNSSEPLEIEVYEGASQLLFAQVIGNSTSEFKLLSPFIINSASIIETPTIIQLEKFITDALAFPIIGRNIYQQRSNLPIAYYDIIEKTRIPGNIPENLLPIYKKIQNIINGEMIYVPAERGFLFVKENGNSIKSFNVASGIKSFGILQLLLASGEVHSNSILIIDEPEVHLHPKWEIEYAKIIADLCKQGIKILVSSHSIYLLDSLVSQIKVDDLHSISKFYFGRKNESEESVFEDVTSDLTPIWEALAEPMQRA